MLDTIYVVRNAVSTTDEKPHAQVFNQEPRPFRPRLSLARFVPYSWVVDINNVGTRTARDPFLSAYGKAQANELADKLVNLNRPIDAVICSPAMRCLETIAPTVERLLEDNQAGVFIKVDNNFGDFTQRGRVARKPESFKVLLDAFPMILDTSYTPTYFRRAGHGPKGRETTLDLHERVGEALHHIIQQMDNDPKGPKTLVICTHGPTMIAIGRLLTCMTPPNLFEDDFSAPSCSLSKYIRQQIQDVLPGHEVVGGWDCELDGDTSHLANGPEYEWTFSSPTELRVAFPTPPAPPSPIAKFLTRTRLALVGNPFRMPSLIYSFMIIFYAAVMALHLVGIAYESTTHKIASFLSVYLTFVLVLYPARVALMMRE